MALEEAPTRQAKIGTAARSFLQDFRQFALKGNVIDLAVAVVVGNAFSRIVNALVSDIIQPLIGLLAPSNNPLQTGAVVLRATSTPATGGSAAPSLVLNYGDFLQSIESFLIIAGAIFVVIKIIAVGRDRLFHKEQAGEAPPPTPTPEVAVLQEIRDTLKEMKGIK